ncbi:MAG: SMP-30/gluconolactonase/LRE family protein [Sphingomonadales bacterium]|jgi:sugar lactone lactonase YvrE
MSWQLVARGGARDTLGEGLFWDKAAGALWWTDIIGQKLWRLTLASGQIDHWALPAMPGWIIGRAGGGHVLGLNDGVYALELAPLRLTRLAEVPAGGLDHRLNDAKADAAGRLWLGTMPKNCQGATGALWRLDATGALARQQHGITIPNGPAISPDGGTLYHTDSAARTIWRFRLQADGTLADQQVHLQFPPGAAPDGMTVDAEGCLWVAFYGGSCVRRFAPDGGLLRQVDLPTVQITNVCFAGPGLDRLFATSAADGRPDDAMAGGLFELDAGGVTGVAPWLFAG